MSAFYSKLLLFGEHIVNCGAKALAIPYAQFNAELSYDKSELSIDNSSIILQKIHDYISSDDFLKTIYDLKRFQDAINKQLVINMNIPIGYGLGSSGAITAAIYSEFATAKTASIQELKEILALTEGVFHGKSSGLDPLVAYLNTAVLIDKEIQQIQLDDEWREHFAIFIVDTEQARKTSPLVKQFMTLYAENSDFKHVVDEKISPISNALIDNYIHKNFESFWENITLLSAMQLEHFSFLVLDKHKTLWQKAIDEKTFFLKICGAGGGGFMLGFAKNKDANLPFEKYYWV